MGATSFVPVISIHGTSTFAKAWAGSPLRGELGDIASAARIRASVKRLPTSG